MGGRGLEAAILAVWTQRGQTLQRDCVLEERTGLKWGKISSDEGKGHLFYTLQLSLSFLR